MPPDTDIDLEIVRKVLAGDRQAFADLVRRHQARLIRLCTSLLKNAADAEDAAQEIFVKAYQSLSDFRQTSSFYTWLYRIASNHCLSLLRTKKRHPSESLQALTETEGGSIEALFFTSKDVRASIEAKDLVEALLSGLRPEQRMLLTLREAEGLSYEEISRVMDISLDAVKARLRRTRQEIDEKLRHLLPGKDV